MSIEIIDILKPKNGLNFKLIEDIDVAVTGYTSLADAVSHFATTTGVTEAINAAIAGKQDALTEAQLAAVNSGITSALVTQIGTNTTAIAGKASQADLTALETEVDGKADDSDIASLQAQIDNIVSGSTADSEVINARVGYDGTSYQTLKARIDAESGRTEKKSTNNYFDKSRIYTGRLNGNYGTILNWSTYRYSDYIKTTANKIYFSQKPYEVYFFNNGVSLGAYSASNLIDEGNGWFSTPEFTTQHDGFAFDFQTANMNIDTLVVSNEVKNNYVAFTGYTTICGEENAAKQDLKALNDAVYRDINAINTSISTINDNIDSINDNIDENIVYNDTANVLNPDTVLVGKRPTITKGEYENSSGFSSTALISVKHGDKVYFNFKPYQMFIWNPTGILVGTPSKSSLTDEGKGWFSYTMGYETADSMIVYWENATGGYDPTSSMIAINIKSDDFIPYGEGFTILYGDRVAKYSEIAKAENPEYTLLTGSAKQVNYRIDNTIAVGDTINLISTNWRSVISTSIPENAIGIYLAGTYDATYPKYAVVDKNDKVLKISALDSAATGYNYGYYVDIEQIADTAETIYFECSSNSESITIFWVYNHNDFNICKGEPKTVTFSSASLTKTYENNMPVMVKTFDNTNNIETIEFTEMQHCRSVGLWLKVADYNTLSALSSIRVSLYKNNDLATTDEAENPQFLQMCNWVFLKVRTLDYEFNKIIITVNFSDTTKTASIEIGAYPIINHFNRPIMSLDFDQTWQATADCGAYDDLFDNNIPFTITGHISHYLEKITAYAKKGMLDIGSYAGSTDGTAIGSQMTLSEMLTALNGRIDSKISEGFDVPSSFGGGGHIIEPKLRRALEISNFKSVKGGSIGGINCATCTDPRYIYISGNTEMAMTLGSVYFFFAHGISSNPSAEENPAMYMSYADFTAILGAIIAHANSGGALVLNMKQYTEFMEKNNLIY